MNYDLLMEEQIKNMNEGSTLLMHACCAPCSSACLERLGNYFDISILYYNPNITDKDEYLKRVEEIKKFISGFKTKYPIKLIEGRYDPKEFFEIAKGLENEPERGKRCFKCYKLRLEETAKVASEKEFDYFCTTLTLSPYKNATWLNEIGEELNNNYNSTYLYSDFKKKNGYKRSIELSKEFDLYRQDYCGCVYSLRDELERKKNKTDN
ncbi:MAG: epoxyqueuosine reductase QueH [Bacilli bacterium]|nr:epoxyqueuosine reductase QueH [Bacilli bacterium]